MSLFGQVTIREYTYTKVTVRSSHNQVKVTIWKYGRSKELMPGAFCSRSFPLARFLGNLGCWWYLSVINKE